MRGLPKHLGTYEDVLHIAQDLPAAEAVAFVDSLEPDAWDRLGATDEQREEARVIAYGRLDREDKGRRRELAKAALIREQIAARSDADAIARDARRIKEELDDVRSQLKDLRADGVEETTLVELSQRLVDLESLFASTLARHNALIAKLCRLRKKAKDEEEV